MNILLRSLFVRPGIDLPDLIKDNFDRVNRSNFAFPAELDQKVYIFIKDFVRTHNQAPSIDTLTTFFESRADFATINRIEHLVSLNAKVKGDFSFHLERKIEEQQIAEVAAMLVDAQRILESPKGIVLNPEKGKKEEKLLRGPQDAVRHIIDNGYMILTSKDNDRLAGNVVLDGKGMELEYDTRKNDPQAGMGQFCGLSNIDDVIGGARKKELWTHAAFTAHMKTTFVLNWLYNQGIHMRHHSLYVSLEVPYDQVRRSLYAIHSFNGKFNDIRCELGIQKHENIPVGLSYLRIRDGKLNPNEERFFKEFVIPDMNDPANGYGAMEVHEADSNKSKFTVDDVQYLSELTYTKYPIQTVFLDHAGLLNSKRNHANQSEASNEAIRDLKKFAMGYRNNSGIAVVALFQINRQGFSAAMKNEGRYNLTHLAYANECEKSSDIVTTTYLDDELRAASKVRFQCLKSRDQGHFDDFEARVEWPCKRIMECDDFDIQALEQMQLGDEIDNNVDDALDF